MARVLVTDAETRTCLAATRALGRAGHAVYVTASRLPALASVSRLCAGSAQVSAPRRAPDAAASELAALVERWAIDVVLPVTDVSSLLVLRRYGGRVGAAVVAAPGLAAFELLSDKAELLHHAARAGLRVPRSVVAHSADDLGRAAEAVGYPCVLKPHTSIVVADGVAHGFGVRHAARPADLFPPFPVAAFPVIAQEYVGGAGEGLFLLVDGEHLLAAFAHRRLREKPPEGGVSTYRESIPLDTDLVAKSAHLLAEVGWRGAAMVEFRRTPGGEAVLMEINGRLWGSLQLAVDAGVDFASLLVALFQGQALEPVTAYRAGVRTRWEWGDVDHVLARLKRLWLGQSAPPGSPGLPRLLWEFVAGFARRDERLEVFRWSDVRPFVRETLDWLQGRGT